jgi:hypothetical protein
MHSYNLQSLKLRDMMAALILGVGAGAIASVAERVDTIFFGSYTPLGYINTYTWILVSALLFGPLGPIITTEIQALIGLANVANPFSWLWLIINPIFAVAASLVSIGITKFNPRARISMRLTLMSLTCAILDIPLVYVVYLVIFTVIGLPFFFEVYVVALLIYIALQLIPTTFLSYVVVRAILRSEILGKRSE